MQGSKIALVRSYLRVSQAAGQVKILIFLVKINFFPIYANSFCDEGQVPIFRYFEAWHVRSSVLSCQQIKQPLLKYKGWSLPFLYKIKTVSYG